MSPWGPLGCDGFSDFPGFWWLTVLKRASQVCCRMSLKWYLPDVFLIRLRLWVCFRGGWERKGTILLACRQGAMPLTWLITGEVDLGHLVEVVRVRFPTGWDVTFLWTPPFLCCTLWRKLLGLAHTSIVWVVQHLFEVVCQHKLFELFCQRSLFIVVIYGLNHALIEVWTTDLYFILWIIIQYHFFYSALRSVQIWPPRAFPVGPCVSLTHRHHLLALSSSFPPFLCPFLPLMVHDGTCLQTGIPPLRAGRQIYTLTMSRMKPCILFSATALCLLLRPQGQEDCGKNMMEPKMNLLNQIKQFSALRLWE